MSDRLSNDDEALSALIDGSLSREQATALRGRLDREPALAARLKAMERANSAVRDAFRDVVDEPLPERVLELLRAPAREGSVVALEARRHRRAPSPWVPQALAAGIALAVGIGLGFGLGQRASDTERADLLVATGAVAPGSALHELLESVPSGETRALDGAATAQARLTFQATDGDWCRELMISSAGASNAALACRRDGDWRIELVGAAQAQREVYRTAGASDLPFEQAIDALIDGEPLEPEAERALVERAWASD